MNQIYFTLCSSNYLSYAGALGRSLKKFDPDLRFIIGLVDRQDSNVDYSAFVDFEILTCFDLGYLEFEDMLSRYNIIEFNTAVKPFYFEYLFKHNPTVEKIYYIDPDICFYSSPLLLEEAWKDAEVLLTPNLVYLSEKTASGELASLRHGMFNLGFIGLKRGEESFGLISWWKDRLREYCLIDKCRGIFVDQKWIDLASLFFDRIKTVKHPGWNMAWWNFSERHLQLIEDRYYVNDDKTPLVFFHFSGFKPNLDFLRERLTRGDYILEPDSPLFKLFEGYREMLYLNEFEKWNSASPLLLFFQPKNTLTTKVGRKVKSKLNNMIYRIFKV